MGICLFFTLSRRNSSTMKLYANTLFIEIQIQKIVLVPSESKITHLILITYINNKSGGFAV